MQRAHGILLVGTVLASTLDGATASAPSQGSVRPKRQIRKIVLDPGHGGEERGALGRGGLDEKTVTLQLCMRLKAVLESEPGVTVLLTREDDRDVGLWDRPAMANRAGANLFVSIHANGSRASVATGVETFFLSLDAPDEEARRLAAIENEVVSAGAAPPEVRDDVNAILWAMAQEAFLLESQTLAERVQAELNRALAVPDRGIKQAPFVVLRNATMPAILVEVGFISNPAIEKKLSDPAYLDLVAGAIARGITSFRAVYER